MNWSPLKNHMDDQGRLVEWPLPRSKKSLQKIALDYLASKFEIGVTYTEKEVNVILKAWHTLRRELYDKRDFDRKNDGSQYWRTPDEADET